LSKQYALLLLKPLPERRSKVWGRHDAFDLLREQSAHTSILRDISAAG
jgi:hypothetical protein